MSTLGRFSLKQRILRAGSWSLAGFVASFALRLGSNLFMTRQLVPEMFGVMAIATMVLVGLALFADLGLKPSIIQSTRGHEAIFLNTAWALQILRGIILWSLAASISLLIPLASSFGLVPKGSVYDSSILPHVLLVLSLTAVISGFESTKSIEAGRNLSIAKLTGMEIGSQLIGFFVMSVWVIFDRTIWALVAGSIASSTTRTILSHHWLSGTRNRWQFDRQAFNEIFRFGKWIFLSSVLYFLASNGDRMILGWYVDARILGAYAIAFLIFSSIDQVLAKITVDLSFPALSEVARERPLTLTRTYYRFHSIVASAAYFSCGLLVVSGPAIVGVLYDSRYEEAGCVLQILALALAVIPLRLATQCFLVFGLSKLYFHLNTVRTIALFLALPIGFHIGGLQGAVWGVVFSSFASAPLIVYYARHLGLFETRRELFALSVLFAGLLSGELLRVIIDYIDQLRLQV
jgi:O-antigen/teichoic acid export membrane protein